MTQQRRVILQVIQDSSEHMTAEEIFMLARQQLPKLALGTVYRNLGLMVESGEILLITIPEQPNHYDKTTCEHDHFRCTECGRLYDMPQMRMMEVLSKELGMTVTGYHLSAEGICDTCKSGAQSA